MHALSVLAALSVPSTRATLLKLLRFAGHAPRLDFKIVAGSSAAYWSGQYTAA